MKTGAILQSGHNKATPDQLYRALVAHKQRLDDTVSPRDSKVVGLTEQAADKFDAPIREFCDETGMHFYHPARRGPNECALLSSRPIASRMSFRLNDKRLDPKVTGRSAPLYVVGFRPRGDSWFGIWHSPAHNGGLDPDNHATDVWLDAWRGMKRWRMRLEGKPTIMGDFNADPNRAHVRDILLARFPKMEWAGTGRQRPTEGGRVIDGFVTRRRVLRRARTLPAMDGFDHRAVIVVLG